MKLIQYLCQFEDMPKSVLRPKFASPLLNLALVYVWTLFNVLTFCERNVLIQTPGNIILEIYTGEVAIMKLESCYTMLVLILNISSKAECLTKRWFYYAKVSRRVQGL